MVLKTCLLVLCLSAIGTNCEKFCDNPVIDSAVTIKDVTYLFRSTNYWIWDHSSNYIEPESSPIHKTFSAMFQEDINDQMHRLNQIDAIFLTVMRLSDGTVDPSRQLLYIFSKMEYYFLSFSVNCDLRGRGNCFSMLSSADSVSIPKGWSVYGGILTDEFPERIRSSIPVGDNVILFHDRHACFIKLNSGGDEEWPLPNDPKIEMDFQDFDDMFEIPFTEDMAMTDGDKYCQFNKNLLDINPEQSKPLNIPCFWRPTKSVFCEMSTTTQPPLITPTTELTIPLETEVTEGVTRNIVTEGTVPTTTTPVTESEGTLQSFTEESTLNDIESEPNSESDAEESEDSVKRKNNLMIIFFVLIFLGLIIVIIVSVVVVSYCVVGSKKRKKYDTSGHSIRMRKGSSASSNSASLSTIATVDTNTGEPRDSNS